MGRKNTFCCTRHHLEIFRVSSSTQKICFEGKQISVNESKLGEVLAKICNRSSHRSVALYQPSPPLSRDFPRKYKFYDFFNRIESIIK